MVNCEFGILFFESFFLFAFCFSKKAIATMNTVFYQDCPSNLERRIE